MSDETRQAAPAPNKASRSFKGWVKPGPDAPGGVEVENGPHGAETLDAISGDFRIFQYRDGHRFSTDDLLVAWYGTSHAPSPARVLDLGSGIGSVGMIAAWRLPRADFVTIEAQAISARLARKSARYNGLEPRYRILEGDFRDPAVLPESEKFDLVLGSPPYFPLDAGILGDHEQKVACRFEVRGDVGDYCRTAARHLAPGGVFAGIFPTEGRARVEAGVESAGGILLRTRDVVFKEGEAPLLFVFVMAMRADLPPSFPREPWSEPALTIRTREGAVHPEYVRVKLSIGFPP